MNKRRKRVGRGPSSGHGKTSSRGHKGAGSRRGYKIRAGYEGGQARLFTKLPHRGFSRGRFKEERFCINFQDIDKIFSDGDVVNRESLQKKRMLKKSVFLPIKILAKGDLTKKVSIEAEFFSESAKKRLSESGIPFKIVGRKDDK